VKSMRKAFCAAVVLLSAWLSSGAAVSEEPFKYQSKGRRDPFVPLVGQHMASRARLQDISSANELVLEGIASGAGGKKVAIINGEVLKEGDTVGNLEIKKVAERTVILSVSGKDYTLTLEEGGGKSER